jgi:DNA-binding NarL/FixJ family response regulator
VGALRRVAAGGSVLDAEVVSRLLASGREDGPLARLTPRDREVLRLVAEGRSNRAIGERLAVTERAVSKHVTSIFHKLELPQDGDDNRRILAVLAYLQPDRARDAAG